MKKKKDKGNFWSMLLSLSLHAGVIGALIYSADFISETPVTTPSVSSAPQPTIEAVVIDQEIINQQAQKIRERQQLAEQKEAERIRRLEQQAEQLERQREAEEQRIRELQAQKLAAEKAARDAEIERIRIAEEQRKANEAVRVAEAKAKAAEAERLKKVAEAKRAEDAAREAEAERVKAEQEAAEAQRKKAEQEAALNELFSHLESETTQRNSAREQIIADEIAQWSGRYRAMIEQQWLVDSSMKNQNCRLNIKLAPDGLVTNVTTISGNTAFCNTAKASIYKIQQFPMPADTDVMTKLRDINLNFAR